MKKKFLVLFLIVLVVGSLSFVATIPLSVAEGSRTVAGIISSDTTWTKTDSPYNLTGLVGVASGVTLTIEPGVVVNLGDYSLQVSGVLYARGKSGENNITFLSNAPAYGNIAFMNGSYGIIENAVLFSTSISINDVSPKIDNNTIIGSLNIDFDAAPLISNNLIAGDIGIHSSDPTIENNSIIGGITIGGNSPMIFNNIIKGGGAKGIGISFDGHDKTKISNNIIYNCSVGVSGQSNATLTGNLIISNDDGIDLSTNLVLLQNNTVAENSVGIRIRGLSNYQSVTIRDNNIQSNKQNSIYLEEAACDVNATHNWWGTIDQQVIDLTIHDQKNEPKLGVVSFVPTVSSLILGAPTTEYTPITWVPQVYHELSAETSSQTKTGTPFHVDILEIAVAAIILSVVINISLVVVVARLLKKSSKQKT